MPDNTASGLTKLTSPESRDLLYIIDVPASNSSSKISKNIDLKTFFGNVPANTSILDNFSVSGNTATMKALTANTLTLVHAGVTPANSTTLTGLNDGQIWSDANYLYRRVGSKIQRIPWNNF